jgi:tetratricopeptide (TPR) repeat protein
MERQKYLVILILFIFSGLGAMATYKTEIYKAYISNNMNEWKKVMDRMNLETKRDNDFLLELLNYQYGYIGWCIGNKENEQAKKYLSLADKNIEILEKQSFELSILNAYKSAFYGYRVGLNKLQAPFIGPKSVESAKKAIELDKNNPYGYIQIGNSEFYMPSVFGGSKTVALENFKKAENLMERNPEKIKNDWNYLSLLAMIVMSCKELKQYELAKDYCEKALKAEPEFLWIKMDLYPEIKNLIKQKK